jgi:hypothetical protein
MVTKEEALQYVQSLGAEHVVTSEELLSAFNAGSGNPSLPASKKVGVTEILSYIGGGIVFLGISILIGQNWSTFGFGTKVLATFGSGIAAYLVGLMFSREERTETVGAAFYLISALVLPIGLYVILNNAGFDANSYASQCIMSTILLGTYFLSYYVFRKNLFVLFSILFGTWLFFSLTSYLVGNGFYSDDMQKFYEYRFLVTGLSYILLGYNFSKTVRASLTGFLYGFGILGVLGAAMTLGGWKPNQDIFWELIYPFLVFGAIFLSISLKSKAFLTWGTIFLMGYILKITSEYFSEGLGWPLALVIAGLAMIGIGYESVSLRKKYLSE